MRSCFFGLVLAAVLAYPATLWGQSISIGSATVPVHMTEITVPWEFLPGAEVQSFGVDLFFDEALLVPRLLDGADGAEVLGCLDAVVPLLQGCSLIAAGHIRIYAFEPFKALGVQGGSVSFEIAPSATGDDRSALALAVVPHQVSPSEAEISVTSGFIEIAWGSPAALEINDAFLVVGRDSSVELEWSFSAGSGLRHLTVDLLYDHSLVAPRLDDDGTAGCLSQVVVPDASCLLVESGRIRIAMSQSEEDLIRQAGTLVFELRSGASGDTFTLLAWDVQESFPVGAPIEREIGRIDVLWGPPATFGIQRLELERGQGSSALGGFFVPEESGLAAITLDVNFDPGYLSVLAGEDGVLEGCLGAVSPEVEAHCVLLEDPPRIRLALDAGDQVLAQQAGLFSFEPDVAIPVDSFQPVHSFVIGMMPDAAPVQLNQGGFEVVRAQPKRLEFVVSPVRGVEMAALAPAALVRIVDAYGYLVDNDNVTEIELNLFGGDEEAVLVGQQRRTVTGGVVEFQGLSVDRPGAEFLLRALDQSSGLEDADSELFDILPDPILVDRFQPLGDQ